MNGENRDDMAECLRRLIDVGVALSVERNRDRLTETILVEAQGMTNAEGGTLYLVNEAHTELAFKILRNDKLGLTHGGEHGASITYPPLPLFGADGRPNLANVATACVHTGQTVEIDDAYQAEGYDFSGTKKFDAGTGYRSESFLTVPLKNHAGRVVGVLQLINARNDAGKVEPFPDIVHPLVEALASLAAVAIDNQQLIEAQRKLFESFIDVLAEAIDAKSPYTGHHCERVPVIAELLVKAACAQEDGPFATYALSDEEWFELRIAAGLHDCGKVVTPEYVIDKATKLETIHDRMHEVRTRFEVLRRDAEIAMLKRQLAGEDVATTEADFAAEVQALEADFALIAQSNIGTEFTSDEQVERIRQIARRTWTRTFDRSLGLSWAEVERLGAAPPTPGTEFLLQDRPDHKVDVYDRGEIYNLVVRRGTLTEEERTVINDHIVVTQEMLARLPFPSNLSQVRNIAGNHHEKMDGTGYPRRLTGEDMSVTERVMVIADIFEALTASDRPYKKPKTLSEAIRILFFMKKDNHIDPDLFDLFLRSGAYREYGARFLSPEQCDEVDIAAYLSAPIA